MFLEEQDRIREKLTAAQAAEIYLKHCTDLPLTASLFRKSSVKDMILAQTGKRRSPSLGGSGNIQEFLMNQDSWSNIPDRRKSVFCANKPTGIAVGGILSLVFPFNNTHCAYVERDFNVKKFQIANKNFKMAQIQLIISCFDPENYEVDDDGRYFNNGVKKIQELQSKFDLEDPDIKAIIKNVNEFLELSFMEGNAVEIVKDVVKRNLPFSITPEAFEVEVCNTKGLLELPIKMQEIWFMGKYLSIPMDDLDEFSNAVERLKGTA